MKNFKKVTAGFISLAMLACIGTVQAFAANYLAGPKLALHKGNTAMKAENRGSLVTVGDFDKSNAAVKLKVKDSMAAKVVFVEPDAAVVAGDALGDPWKYDYTKGETTGKFTPDNTMALAEYAASEKEIAQVNVRLTGENVSIGKEIEQDNLLRPGALGAATVKESAQIN